MANTDVCHDLPKAAPGTVWLFLQTQVLPCVICSASHKFQKVYLGPQKRQLMNIGYINTTYLPSHGLKQKDFIPRL